MKTLLGILSLWFILWGVDALLRAIGLNDVPASIAALALVTFAALCSGGLARFIAPGADKLIQYMPLFFIPILVGVMAEQDMLRTHWVLLLFTVIGTTLIGLVCTAFIYHLMGGRSRMANEQAMPESGQGHD